MQVVTERHVETVKDTEREQVLETRIKEVEAKIDGLRKELEEANDRLVHAASTASCNLQPQLLPEAGRSDGSP